MGSIRRQSDYHGDTLLSDRWIWSKGIEPLYSLSRGSNPHDDRTTLTGIWCRIWTLIRGNLWDTLISKTTHISLEKDLNPSDDSFIHHDQYRSISRKYANTPLSLRNISSRLNPDQYSDRLSPRMDPFLEYHLYTYRNTLPNRRLPPRLSDLLPIEIYPLDEWSILMNPSYHPPRRVQDTGRLQYTRYLYLSHPRPGSLRAETRSQINPSLKTGVISWDPDRLIRVMFRRISWWDPW